MSLRKRGFRHKIDFLDSRLRGNDEWMAHRRTKKYFEQFFWDTTLYFASGVILFCYLISR
jgi:hypothetical protein